MDIIIEKKPIYYPTAIAYMQERVNQILSKSGQELLWFLEHESVYTYGASYQNQLSCIDDVPVIPSSRGGKLTYHGPGQQIIYLLLDLKRRKACDIHQYINSLEMCIIDILHALGIEGIQHQEHRGVWVYDSNHNLNKIAAIGIKISRWITYHGVAINIKNALMKYYSNISPCGIKELGVTSLENLGINIESQKIRDLIVSKFRKNFYCA
ncbi:MAG: lipoyltransferase [Candidatus Xenolissoclinum pacificiensis L6]|uniref:Octanoyltransferase n=1 Tax=Candidatus Xenolissoclinum pacificiensis L6 TaxID=1401685 RepID=W2V248_9RICK|nr:MAG: lipoyltransferase [Candidatus Xenolissoclinum pacificiensis L6]